MDVVLRQTEQLPQVHFLQLVLLCSADIEERRNNVGDESEDCVAKWSRQHWVQLSGSSSEDTHKLAEKERFYPSKAIFQPFF